MLTPSPLPSSTKLSLNITIPLPSLLGTKAQTAMAIMSTHRVRSLRQPINTINAAVFQKRCPFTSVNNFTAQILTKQPRPSEKEGESSSHDKPEFLDGLEPDMKTVVQRLKTAAERIRKLEMEKFMGRVKGELAVEEILLAEKMSEEIVAEFLEKPIGYLRSKSCHENLEEKVKNVDLLVNILETSCLRN